MLFGLSWPILETQKNCQSIAKLSIGGTVILHGLVRELDLLTNFYNTPTGASTNPKNLDLNKNLNLTKIENEILNLKLKFENLEL